jgi:transposase
VIEGFMRTAVIKLWQDGKSKKFISRVVNHDIKTIRKIIKSYEQEVAGKLQESTKVTILSNYQDQIQQFLEQNLSKVRIFEELQKAGYNGSYPSLTNYARGLEVSGKVCVRFHTLAGEEAQVDFGEVGKLPNIAGGLSKAYVFNMRLSYSRLDYYQVVFNQKVETFIECHINAFKYFKGIPQQVRIDNLKSAVLEASFYEPIYQSQYENLSNHYNFEIIPCRVRKPQEKGKVESGIKYIQNNFFVGRKFMDNADLNKQLNEWLDGYCNQRIHGTTKEKPITLFLEKEAKALKPLPREEFKIGVMFSRKVHVDCHITFEHNYYSVPYSYVGKNVEIAVDAALIRIFCNNEPIALHTRLLGKGKFSTISAHYPKYKNFTSDSPEYLNLYEEKMSQVGEHTKMLFCLIVKEQPSFWYRTVKGILSLKKTYPDHVIELACKRAIYFSITHYLKIKSICESGCYSLELPNDNSN